MYLLRVTSLVRMLLDCNLSERFLDLILRRFLAHIKKCIVLSVVYLLLLLRTLASTASHEML